MGRKLFSSPLKATPLTPRPTPRILTPKMPITLSSGTKTPTFPDAFPLIMDLVSKLIPLKTAVESVGLDPEKFQEWMDKRPACVTEYRMVKSTAMIDAQTRMMAGSKGWQALARALESLDGEIWIKKSGTAFGKSPNTGSPYAKSIKR